MKVRLDKKLFWFLKDDAELDLSDAAGLEMYLQQVVSCGRTEDVKSLLARVNFEQFKKAFGGIKRFLPWEVKAFWEDFIADH